MINKNFMKAKAGFIMLFISMMCFTGFGNTTADLSQDSTDSSIVDFHDAELSVVTLTTFTVVENQDVFAETEFDVIISETLRGQDNLIESNSANAYRDFISENIRYVTDVGWQSKQNYDNENHTLKNTNFHFSARKARDGIMQNSFHFS